VKLLVLCSQGVCWREEAIGRGGGSGFGEGVVDWVRDNCVVRVVGESRIQKRFDAVEVEVVGVDSRIKS